MTGTRQVRDGARLSVVLLAYGGPTDVAEVEPFLRRIMRPAEPSTEMVARARARYQAIGGGSPLIANTLRQRDALRAYLCGEGAPALREVFGLDVGAEVFVGMRHTSPSITDALREALAWGEGKVVAVIMASHQSERATGGYHEDVRRALAHEDGDPRDSGPPARGHAEVAFVRPWHTDPGYLDAVADRTRTALEGLGPGRGIREGGPPPTIVFSAHSLPLSGGEGDPQYERGLFDTARGVMSRIGDLPWRIAYQSRSGRPGTVWLGPGVEDVLAEERARGVERVVVVPLGFVVEHLETLYDLDVALWGEADRLGLVMSRAATVTDHPSFVSALGAAVVQAVREAGWAPTSLKETDAEL